MKDFDVVAYDDSVLELQTVLNIDVTAEFIAILLGEAHIQIDTIFRLQLVSVTQ